MMRIFVLIGLLFSFAASAKDVQFNINLGMDQPDSTGVRNTTANFLQFQAANYSSFLRLKSSLTVLVGSGYTQGEFALGPSIYFLSPLVSKKAAVQPFFYGEGAFGVGTFNELSRQDTGFGIGVGVDLRLFDKSGLTITIHKQAATENSIRYILGMFVFSR